MTEGGAYGEDLLRGTEFKVSNQSQPSHGYNYLVSAHKPTCVQACATGQLTSSDDLNLVVARNNLLELHLVTPEGLKLLKEISIYGRIVCMNLFTPRRGANGVLADKTKDLIFILTHRYHVMILECHQDGDNLDIVTRAHGNVADMSGKECESGMQAVIDPEATCIVLRLYEGIVKVIPLEDHCYTELLAFNVRLDELQVGDLQFLHGCATPTLIKLHQDSNGRHIRTHTLSLKDKEFVKVPWKLDNVEAEAMLIIAVPEPLCGAVVVGQETITYVTPEAHRTVAFEVLASSTVNCYAPVDTDGSRYLLGDLAGQLFMLLLEKPPAGSCCRDPDIKLELLGEICIPECLTYLDNGVIYIGSRLGDSRLVRLNKIRDPVTKSFITTMQTFPNLGPIVDMTVVDLERQGQGQLITCSGAYKEGSLRIIRNGVGLQELACIELGKIRGMWSLRVGVAGEDGGGSTAGVPAKGGATDEMHNTLVVTFHSSTRFLKVGGDIVDEIRIPGFISKKMTFYAANVNFNQVVQVTRCGVRLVSVSTCRLLQHWAPPDERPVSLATSNSVQLIVTSGAWVYYLAVGDGELQLKGQCQLEHEVACVDVSPLGGDMEAGVVSVGMWSDITTRILTLPDLKEVYKEPLGGDIIPRSMLLATFEGVHYLLVAIGDGQLVYYVYDRDRHCLTDRKRVVVGMLPTQLRRFSAGSVSNVFACSDRPTVIYSSNHKLVFSKVNLKEVTHMCPLNSEAFPNSLALANSEGVTIGTIDEIQKLHIRTVPLGETPRCIAYQEETETFAVATFRMDVCTDTNLNTNTSSSGGGGTGTSSSAATVGSSATGTACSGPTVPGYGLQYGLGPEGSQPASLTAQSTSYALTTTSIIKTNMVPAPERGQEIETYNLLIMAQNTFEVIHCHTFCPHEYVMSLVSTRLRDDPQPYFIVGTAIVNPEEGEPKVGRIVIFSFTDSKLIQVAEKEVKGAVFSLRAFQGKLLAAITNTVRLFEWTQEKELQMECSHFNQVIALFVKMKGDFILVGDLMRSFTLLQYKTLEGNFEEIARDFVPNWLTAVEILDDEFYLGGEQWNNLVVCHKDSGASTDEERQQMVDVGRIHLGEQVNVFCPGSLVMRGGEAGPPGVAQSGVLLGTASGGISLCISISGDLYTFLTELSSRLAKTIKSVGKVSHTEYRSFFSDRRVEKSQGFVDGDLVENFLDLPRDKMEEVCGNLTMLVNGQRTTMTVSDVIKLVEELSRLH